MELSYVRELFVPPLCHKQTMPTGLCSKIYRTHRIGAKESSLPQTLLAGSVLSFCSSSVSPLLMELALRGRLLPAGLCRARTPGLVPSLGAGESQQHTDSPAGEPDKPERGLHHHLERQRLPDLLQTHFAFAINDGNGKLILKRPTHNV